MEITTRSLHDLAKRALCPMAVWDIATGHSWETPVWPQSVLWADRVVTCLFSQPTASLLSTLRSKARCLRMRLLNRIQ